MTRPNSLAIPLAIVLLGPAVGLVGCEESSSRGGPASISDPRMDAAVARGTSTFPLFLNAFRNQRPGWTGFQVRYALTNDAGFRDSIWLDLQSINDKSKLVTLVPEDEDERTSRFEPGSEVVIDPSDVTDWLFIDEHGTFVGGYTLRVTMDRIGNTSGDRDNVHGGIPFRDLDGPESPSD